MLPCKVWLINMKVADSISHNFRSQIVFGITFKVNFVFMICDLHYPQFFPWYPMTSFRNHVHLLENKEIYDKLGFRPMFHVRTSTYITSHIYVFLVIQWKTVTEKWVFQLTRKQAIAWERTDWLAKEHREFFFKRKTISFKQNTKKQKQILAIIWRHLSES